MKALIRHYLQQHRLSLRLSLLAVPLSVYAATQNGLIEFKPGQVVSSAELNANFKYVAESPRNCPPDMKAVGDFCIDQYEASIWSAADGGQQYNTAKPGDTPANPYPAACLPNGYGCNYYARSVPGVMPAYGVTWYQANAACENAGKRLPTNAEWQVAVTGTVDPGAAGSGDGNCNTSSGSIHFTANACLSKWGVADMIGNLTEWVADWQGVIGANGEVSVATAAFGTDGYIHGGNRKDSNVSAGVNWSTRPLADTQVQGRGNQIGEEIGYSAFQRGGSYADGTAGGAFMLRLDRSPDYSDGTVGFRCARNR